MRKVIQSVTILLLIVLGLSSCASMTRTPLPEQYSGKANIAGMPQVRDFSSGHSDYYQKDFEDSLMQHISSMPEGYNMEDDTIYILALSGGGANGAFGAVLINGWDATGTRPVFTPVTCISTGSLIAPFSFLG